MRFERLYTLGWSGHAQLHRLLAAAIKITGQIFTCHTQMHVHTQTHTHHTRTHAQSHTTYTTHTTSSAVKESAVYPPSHSEGKAPLARKMHTHWTGHILCVASNLGKKSISTFSHPSYNTVLVQIHCQSPYATAYHQSLHTSIYQLHLAYWCQRCTHTLDQPSVNHISFQK